MTNTIIDYDRVLECGRRLYNARAHRDAITIKLQDGDDLSDFAKAILINMRDGCDLEISELLEWMHALRKGEDDYPVPGRF